MRCSLTMALALALAACSAAPAGEAPDVSAVPDFGGPPGGAGSGAGADAGAVDGAGPLGGNDSGRAPAVDAGAGAMGDAGAADAAGLTDAVAPDAALPDAAGAPDVPGAGSDAPGGPDAAPDTAPPTLGALHLDDPVTLAANPTVNYRGVDAAWDPAAGAFLFAYGNAPIGGAWVGPDGAQIGGGFLLTDAPFDGSNWTQNPRVCPSAGGSLVSWHQELAGGPHVEVRYVRREGDGPGFVGPAVALSGPGSQQESPAALGWAPDAGEHLVVWAQGGLHGRRLTPSGAPLADAAPLTEPGMWVEFPSVAWHPAGGWFVATMQESPSGARVLLLRLDGALTVLETRDLTGNIAFAKVTDVEIAGGEVIATWYEIRDGVAGFAAQRFTPDGAPASGPLPVFVPHGTYDGYDLSCSAVTGTCLGVFHGPSVEPWAAELLPDLTSGAAFPLASGGAKNGSFLPRAVADPAAPAWLVAFSPDYSGVVVQRVVRE